MFGDEKSKHQSSLRMEKPELRLNIEEDKKVLKTWKLRK